MFYIYVYVYVCVYPSDYVWSKSTLIAPTYYYLLFLHIFSLAWNVKLLTQLFFGRRFSFHYLLLCPHVSLFNTFSLSSKATQIADHIHTLLYMRLSALLPFNCAFLEINGNTFMKTESAVSRSSLAFAAVKPSCQILWALSLQQLIILRSTRFLYKIETILSNKQLS